MTQELAAIFNIVEDDDEDPPILRSYGAVIVVDAVAAIMQNSPSEQEDRYRYVI